MIKIRDKEFTNPQISKLFETSETSETSEETGETILVGYLFTEDKWRYAVLLENLNEIEKEWIENNI
jgi:hypothetical protein